MNKATTGTWKTVLDKTGLKFKEFLDLDQGIIFYQIWLNGSSLKANSGCAALYLNFSEKPPFEYLNNEVISYKRTDQKNDIKNPNHISEWISIFKSSNIEPKLVKVIYEGKAYKMLYVKIGGDKQKFGWFFAVNDFDMVYATFFSSLK